jgi:Major Facilitator Superfamily
MLRGSKSPGPIDEAAIPLHAMRRFSNEVSFNGEAAGEQNEDGEQDIDPLLPSEGGYLARVKAEIEHELGGASGDTAYDRMYLPFLRTQKCPLALSLLSSSFFGSSFHVRVTCGIFCCENVSGGQTEYRNLHSRLGKSKIVNKAIQDIGIGRYQWHLFSLCGMGWLADNLWMQGLALVLPQLSPEFGVSSSNVRYTTMITYIGLSFGSTFWGIASDIIGRRPAFNITLFLCGLFGTMIALGPTWITTSLLFACMGLGVGGNLPVDGALFLEFLPFESNKLLTLLSVWWPVGQLIASIR